MIAAVSAGGQREVASFADPELAAFFSLPPNGPRISCGDFVTAHYLTFLRYEAPASCMRLLGGIAHWSQC